MYDIESDMHIHRFCSHNDDDINKAQGVFGYLFINNQFICYTVEKPWRYNEPFMSCVPNGVYNLVEWDSERFGKTFALSNPYYNVYADKDNRRNESDRYACIFHGGNTHADVHGCIAPGLALGSIKNKWAVLQSRDAMKKLRGIWKKYPPKYLHITSELTISI